MSKIRKHHHIWCNIGQNPSTAKDCPECERLEKEFPPDGECIVPKYVEEKPPKPHRPEKYCKYCGGQNLKRTEQIVFGEPGMLYTYTCRDCEDNKDV